MKGTNSSHPHCVALQGKIGDWVSCAIYATRPSPCHEFGIKWQDGVLVFEPGDLERCNQARAAYGLPPISMGMSRHRHHCEHRANKARYTRVHHVVLASHARRTARSLYA
jgi:Fe-S-cluster containining protein